MRTTDVIPTLASMTSSELIIEHKSGDASIIRDGTVRTGTADLAASVMETVARDGCACG